MTSVLVFSFFPGNNSTACVGGFDWILEGSPSKDSWLKSQLADVLAFAGDVSYSVVRLLVPDNLTNDQITDEISSLEEFRELPIQEDCPDQGDAS